MDWPLRSDGPFQSIEPNEGAVKVAAGAFGPYVHPCVLPLQLVAFPPIRAAVAAGVVGHAVAAAACVAGAAGGGKDSELAVEILGSIPVARLVATQYMVKTEPVILCPAFALPPR